MMVNLIVKYYLFFKWKMRKLIRSSIGKKSRLFVNCFTSYPDKSLIRVRDNEFYGLAIKECEENRGQQSEVKDMITNMCSLINENILQSLPEFRATEIYNQLCSKPVFSGVHSSIEQEVFGLITTLFESSIYLLKIICPVLNEFEICLLILIKADLQLSVICTYLGIDDPSVLYQRKYRMKKKICSQLHGKMIYTLLLGNK